MTQATIYSVPLVGPATPTAIVQRIDDNFDAIISGQSGSSRPSYAVAGTVWQDTSVAGLVKYYHYDGSDDILLRTIDTTNNRVDQPPQAFASVASAATTDIGAVTSKNVTVTGTTTITSFGTAPAGTERRLRLSGALTLTYNATSLILPGAVNITTVAGDTLEAVSLGSGNWVVTSYQTALPIFTKQFDSTQQTITSGGAITVAHGFGALPKLIQILLICTTADAGYSIGDVVPVAFNGPANNNNSVGATYDGTNINLRYGTNASVFTYTHKSTGASTALVNGSWRMIVRSWA